MELVYCATHVTLEAAMHGACAVCGSLCNAFFLGHVPNPFPRLAVPVQLSAELKAREVNMVGRLRMFYSGKELRSDGVLLKDVQLVVTTDDWSMMVIFPVFASFWLFGTDS